MRGWELELAMRDVAERQHGVAARRQLRALASSREALRSRLRTPGWQELSPNVVRHCGSPGGFAQRCAAAVLDIAPEAYVSRMAAAALWELPGFPGGAVHVTRPISASSRTSQLAVVHESRFLPRHHGTIHRGIPLTTVARTLFDLSGCLHPLRSERAVDNALRHQFVELEVLRRTTIELLARGRRGSRRMRELLAARGAGYIPTGSGLEADFLALLVAAGLELPEGQVDLGGDGWIGRVDFYYRRLRLVIEIDSDLYHSVTLDVAADDQRDRALRAAGFRVMRVTQRQLRDHPDEVVAAIRAELARHAI